MTHRSLFLVWMALALVGLPSLGTADPVYDDDFAAKVRAYLLDHPEVILEAMETLAEKQAALERAAQIDAVAQAVFEGDTGLGLGALEPDRVIVEYFDYRCAPCKAIHPRLKELVAAHPGLRIVKRHLPILSPASERAARIALATRELYGMDAYIQIHDALFAHRGAFSTGLFARVTGQLGFDLEALEERGEGDDITALIDGNRDVAVTLVLSGTPSFVTAEDIVVGFPNEDTLARLVASARSVD